jgi:hypothetical protein
VNIGYSQLMVELLEGGGNINERADAAGINLLIPSRSFFVFPLLPPQLLEKLL